jgi:hypothetical protein
MASGGFELKVQQQGVRLKVDLGFGAKTLGAIQCGGHSFKLEKIR